jgi:[ribulose-bisphosphate carboxylase]-lysine N-methyltransferase
VSEENEKAVYESMVSGCAAVLQTYPTKIDDDIALLNRMDGMSNENAAVSLRLKEKEVLEATLRFFEDRMSLLESLEYYGDRRLKRLGLLDKEGKPTDWDSFFDDGIA